MATKRTHITTILGPGILMAAAAIGASHLVQSTRAGADYGWQLVWLVLIVNLAKYPFFQIGQRYTAATHETVLHGYRRLGVPFIAVFLGVSFVTMIISISALAFLTAGLAINLFGDDFILLRWVDPDDRMLAWVIVMLAICTAILAAGRYRILDSLTKVIIAVLGICAIIALIVGIANPTPVAEGLEPASPWKWASFGFLIALMGWMPAPIELSAWPSVWMEEREAETGYRPTVREALIDFNTGYVATVLLALVFLGLGALMMHPTGESFSQSGVAFSQELVQLFTQSIGTWIGPVIALAAFACLFSTTLTCLDGYPRSVARAAGIAKDADAPPSTRMFWFFNGIALVASVLVAWLLTANLRQMIDAATIISFLTAPIFAFLNLRLISSRNVPAEHRPGRGFMALCYFGIAFLALFSIAFMIWKAYGWLS